MITLKDVIESASVAFKKTGEDAKKAEFFNVLLADLQNKEMELVNQNFQRMIKERYNNVLDIIFMDETPTIQASYIILMPDEKQTWHFMDEILLVNEKVPTSTEDGVNRIRITLGTAKRLMQLWTHGTPSYPNAYTKKNQDFDFCSNKGMKLKCDAYPKEGFGEGSNDIRN